MFVVNLNITKYLVVNKKAEKNIYTIGAMGVKKLQKIGKFAK